jgi:CHASE3 domain sensor protein
MTTMHEQIEESFSEAEAQILAKLEEQRALLEEKEAALAIAQETYDTAEARLNEAEAALEACQNK